jgi:hypothetical protein
MQSQRDYPSIVWSNLKLFLSFTGLLVAAIQDSFDIDNLVPGLTTRKVS